RRLRIPRSEGSNVTAAEGAIQEVRNQRLRLLARNARSFASRFATRTDGVVGLAVLIVFAVLALKPELFVGQLETATRATGHAFDPPSSAHIFGADDLGRDVLNRTVHGARISMTIGLLATLITVVIGTLVGIIAGYVGGVVDTVLMRVSDLFLVLPTFVLAIIVVIGLTSWATTARIIRSQVLSLKGRMFVDRARVIGAGPGRIMIAHILP